MPIKASTSNCIWEISLETSGPGASVGAQLLIWSHPADFAREKRGSWDLRAGCFDCILLHVCSRSDFGLNRFPLLLKGPFFFLAFASRTLFHAQFCRTSTAVRQFGGGDVFPPTRLPAVPKCLPGSVRERETGSANTFVPGREHRNRWKSVSHCCGSHVGVGHVRQSVRTQLQRFLTVHQRGLGSFLTNGKNNCVALFFIFFIFFLLYVPPRWSNENCFWSMAPPLPVKTTKTIPDNLNKYNVLRLCVICSWILGTPGPRNLQFGGLFGMNVKSLTCGQKEQGKNNNNNLTPVNARKIFCPNITLLSPIVRIIRLNWHGRKRQSFLTWIR